MDFEDSDVGSRKRTRGAADASKISNNEPTTTRSGRVTKPRDSNGEYGAEATSDAAERQRGEDSQSELPSVHIENGFNYEEYESAEDPSGAEDGQANESGYEDQGSELEENEDDLSDAAGDEELIPERRTLKVALRVPISSFGKLPTTNGASKMDAPPVLPDSGYNSISGEPMNVVRHPDTANALAM